MRPRDELLALLNVEIAASSVAAVAERLGVSRPLVSRVIHGNYGNDARFFARVEEVLGAVDCPYLSERIANSRCRSIALGACPSQSADDVAHWRACQHCPNRPAAGRGED